ncbi:MAG: DUF3048 domain-containing protein [Acidimicrobiales bacterium]
MRRSLFALVVIAVLAVTVLTYRHQSASGDGSTTSTSSTTTTTVPPDIAPLTGLADPAGQAAHRPALTVKIENTPEAMPQWGLDQADVVYEEIVNGGITRLAAVFNSHAPAKIGPVRSVRPTDEQIVFPLGGIFAFSGGAPYALAAIAKAPVTLVQESNAGAAMFRDPNRVAPHNLYAVGPSLFTFKGTPVPPKPLFTYRAASTRVLGPAVASLTVPFPSIYAVTWTWDATTASWDRTLFGQPVITGTGVRVSPVNVLVMWVDYVNGVGTFTSYANLLGSGPVTLFSAGKEVQGTWSRGPSLSDPIVYKSASGKPLALTPGQTWVELLNTGAVLSVQH